MPRLRRRGGRRGGKTYQNFQGMGADFSLAIRELIKAQAIGITLYAEEIFESLLEKTPIDTGEARGSWTISLNGPNPANDRGPSSATHIGQSLTAEERSYVKSKMQSFINGGKEDIWFVNDSGYAKALEYGHSKQAPSGMIRRTGAQVSNGGTYLVNMPRGPVIVKIRKK